MTREARHHHHKPLLLPDLCQIAHAIGRIRQSVQQHRRAENVALRQQYLRAVPVGVKTDRVNAANKKNDAGHQQPNGKLSGKWDEFTS